MTTLRKGSTGAEVKEVQRLLNLAGAGLTVDGDFGEKTRKAVVTFQLNKGLDADGIVGEKTWLELKLLENPVIPLINQCVKDIQASPSFKRLLELMDND